MLVEALNEYTDQSEKFEKKKLELEHKTKSFNEKLKA